MIVGLLKSTEKQEYKSQKPMNDMDEKIWQEKKEKENWNIINEEFNMSQRVQRKAWTADSVK